MVMRSTNTQEARYSQVSEMCLRENWLESKNSWGAGGGRVPVGQEIVRAKKKDKMKKKEKEKRDSLRRNICQSFFFFWHVFDGRRDENFVLYWSIPRGLIRNFIELFTEIDEVINQYRLCNVLRLLQCSSFV